VGLEIRLLTDDELEAAESISAEAFGSPRRNDMAERMQRVRERTEAQWYLGAFDGQEMTSMMRMVPNEMYINGARIGFGAVSPVASSPLHRRKGHTGALLRHSLGLMWERGQALSGLYTPHPAFYRRYGWEIAAHQRRYRFKPKDLALQFPPSQRGSFEALKGDDLADIKPVYARYAERGNGTFARDDDRWWKSYVLDSWRGPGDIVLWRDDAGEAQGYAVFMLPGSGPDAEKVIVAELVALTGDAHANLLTYFGNYDIHNEVVVYGSPHDAIDLQFVDTERLEMTEHFSVMLRIVDFEAAMSARPPARAAHACELLLSIDDASAAWNHGVWRVAIGEGTTSVSRADEAPELTVSERILAPLFTGHLSPWRAYEAGLVRASDEDVLRRADQVFATNRPPFFPDHF
jgi:predicted acetyltransferase